MTEDFTLSYFTKCKLIFYLNGVKCLLYSVPVLYYFLKPLLKVIFRTYYTKMSDPSSRSCFVYQASALGHDDQWEPGR